MSTWAFLREFVRAPERIGSVTPSSRYLAELVVDTAEVRPGHVVVELGAGTGPVTAELLRRHPDARLLAFEPTPKLASLLRSRFPDLEVLEQRADRDLPRVLAERGCPRVDRVVSGLPWTLWPEELQDDVFSGIVGALAPDGRFLTYTYLPSQLRPAGRRFRRVARRWFRHVWFTPVRWANLPPAVVLVGDGPRPR